MAAILGLDGPALDALCKGIGAGYVAVANYNCPGQVVVSGEKAAVEELIVKAKEAGARRALPLSVSVPSHSALMQEAAERFRDAISGVEIRDAGITFFNNADARPLSGTADIRESLIRQLSMPVRWEELIRNICASGVTTFVEAGPGKVLTGLIKRISPEAELFNVEDMEGLEKTAAGI
jgi:[acyl-carrier-protein] S-malonyltransferase